MDYPLLMSFTLQKIYLTVNVVNTIISVIFPYLEEWLSPEVLPFGHLSAVIQLMVRTL